MLMLPSDESKLAGGASQVAGWGEVFRCLVRGAQFCLAVWNFRSE